MKDVHEPAMTGKSDVSPMPSGAGVVPSSRLDAEGWYTVEPGDCSPFERARDAEIEERLERDGRPLSLLAIVAQQRGARWQIEILHRLDLLERLDIRGRTTEHESDRVMCKKVAAWIRGLPHGVCPELFSWEDGPGKRLLQRATLTRAKGDRR